MLPLWFLTRKCKHQTSYNNRILFSYRKKYDSFNYSFWFHITLNIVFWDNKNLLEIRLLYNNTKSYLNCSHLIHKPQTRLVISYALPKPILSIRMHFVIMKDFPKWFALIALIILFMVYREVILANMITVSIY